MRIGDIRTIYARICVTGSRGVSCYEALIEGPQVIEIDWSKKNR